MVTRRQFMGSAAIVTATGSTIAKSHAAKPTTAREPVRPVVISTWQHGMAANAEAWKTLSTGGRALDAVENGVRVTESNPDISTVGIGVFPDASGTVTLDA